MVREKNLERTWSKYVLLLKMEPVLGEWQIPFFIDSITLHLTMLVWF